MSVAALSVLLAVAGGAATWQAASLLAAVAWRHARLRLGQIEPASQARTILALRLAPPLLAVVAALVLVLPAMLVFEPRDAAERPGIVLLLVASAGAAAVARAAARVWTRAVATRRWLRMHAGGGVAVDGLQPPLVAIDAGFPVFAVAGVFRPRVLVSTRVLSACPPSLVEAMLAHEREHLRARDNVCRWLLLAGPLAPGAGRAAAAMDAAWARAREHAADLAAARSRPGAALDLAEALVRVARLAAGAAPPALEGSMLFEGGGIEARVRRLVTPPDERTPNTRLARALAVGMSVVLVALASPPGLRLVHAVAELAIYRLP